MKPQKNKSDGFKLSMSLHGIVIVLILAVPWILHACKRSQPQEKLVFVDFTVAIPPPSASDDPPMPQVAPPMPKPADDIQIPEKTPEPAKPDPPKTPVPKPPPTNPPPPKSTVVKQTTRITRTHAPLPQDTLLTEDEIRRRLLDGAIISPTNSAPLDRQSLSSEYLDQVHTRMYRAWEQPAQLRNLPGLRSMIAITVQPDGRITARRLVLTSGNALMDESVMRAVQSVQTVRALPASYNRPIDIDITFELSN